MSIVETGCTYVINGRGDLGMDAEVKMFIDEEVVVLRRAKSGLYIVTPKINPKIRLAIAKKNLTPIG